MPRECYEETASVEFKPYSQFTPSTRLGYGVASTRVGRCKLAVKVRLHRMRVRFFATPRGDALHRSATQRTASDVNEPLFI